MTSTQERRIIVFHSFDEVVADAERLAAGEVRTTGQHSFGQILEHLSRTHDLTTGRVQGPRPPWYMRLIIPFIKPMILKDQPVKPGFKLPPDAEAFFWEEGDVDVAQALAHLKDSVEYYHSHGPLPKHPMFGKMTSQQNLSLNLRHAALHLSFVHPV